MHGPHAWGGYGEPCQTQGVGVILGPGALRGEGIDSGSMSHSGPTRGQPGRQGSGAAGPQAKRVISLPFALLFTPYFINHAQNSPKIGSHPLRKLDWASSSFPPWMRPTRPRSGANCVSAPLQPGPRVTRAERKERGTRRDGSPFNSSFGSL